MGAMVELWTDLACAGGVRKARIVEWVSGSYNDTMDQTTAQLSLATYRGAHWMADLDVGTVIRVTNHIGVVTEWTVSSVIDSDGTVDELVHITAEHPIMRLARCGPIRDVASGGQVFENLGLDNGTPRHFFDTFILPTLTLYGLDWVQAGTWDWTDRYSIAWQSWTPLQLLNELKNKTRRAEIDFRRVGDTHYAVDFLMRRGAAAPVVLLHPRKNVRTIRREYRVDRISTVIQPQGQVVNGAVEPSGIQYACAKITAIQIDTPQAGRHTLTVAYPESGSSDFIVFDDQYGGSGLPELPNRWALLPDASLVEIVDTVAATQDLVVEGDISALSVGDHIELRADDQGTHLTELANPAAVARWGRIHRTLQVSEARGERNMVRNPFGLASEDAVVVTCRKSGAVVAPSTSVALKDLPPGLEILAGDRLSRSVTAGLASFRVEADAVVDGSGNVTVTVHQASTWLDNEPVHIHRQAGTRQPTAWEYPATIGPTLLLAHRDPSVSGPLTAEADGAQSFTQGTSLPHVKLRGLTPGDVVQYGDVVLNTPVMQGGVADGDGKLTVGLLAAPSVSLTDGQQVMISRPALLNDGGQRAIGLQFQGTPNLGLWTPPVTVRHDETLPVARAFVAIEYWNPRNSPRTLGAAANTHGVQVRVRDVTGGGSTQLAVVADKDPRTIPAMSTAPVIFSLPFQLSSTREVVIDITPPGPTSGDAGMTASSAVFVFVRWAMITLSPDPDVPFTPASHGNVLVREGLATLLEESTEELVAGYEVQIRDLSAAEGYIPTDEELVIGSEARLYSEVLGVDATVRIVDAVYDLRNPENTSITLASDPRLLSRTLSRQRGLGTARVTVQVDVAASEASGLAGGGTGGPVSTTPEVRNVEVPTSSPGQTPVRTIGARRAVLPPGDVSTVGTVTVEPLDPKDKGERIVLPI